MVWFWSFFFFSYGLGKFFVFIFVIWELFFVGFLVIRKVSVELYGVLVCGYSVVIVVGGMCFFFR